jgi:DNA-binding MarR family transcriptional regulator
MLGKSAREPLATYLDSVLHADLQLREWQGAARLPRFLVDAYELLQGELLGRAVLFAVIHNDDIGPAEAAKQLRQIAKATDHQPILVAETISAPARRKLIELGVPFIVLFNQLYLPDFGMDLREHFRALRERTSDGMSPSTQVLLFDHLLKGIEETLIPSRIAARLSYSAMTVGRAMDELEELGLAQIRKIGREKHLSFLRQGRDLFEAALPYLRDPVRDRQPVRGFLPEGVLPVAGDEALGHYTDLAPGRLRVFATAPRVDVIGHYQLERSAPFDADFELETWRYDPHALAVDGVVDRLSLFVRYRENPDPRVAGAANRLLEDISWQS